MSLFGRKSGVGGQATVLGLELRSWRQTQRRDQVYLLSLEVSVPGQAPFRAQVDSSVPYDRVPRVGQRLRVSVRQSDPAKITIDWASVPSLVGQAQAASAAASAGDPAGAAAALGLTTRPEVATPEVASPEVASPDGDSDEQSGPPPA